MRNILIIILVMLSCGAAAGSEFDHAILERVNFPASPGEGLSLDPSLLCRPGYGATFLHTNPYRVSGLSWDFVFAHYGRRGLGIFGAFRSYRLSDLYNDLTITAGVASHVYRGLFSSLSVSRRREDFKGDDDFARTACDFRVSYDGGVVVAQAGLEEMVIQNPYAIPAGGRSEPALRATYFATPEIALSAGFRRDQFGRDRFTFGQDVAIIRGLRLRLGYMSNPGTLDWGLDLSYKSLTFMFDYIAANRLSDSVILGLSMGN